MKKKGKSSAISLHIIFMSAFLTLIVIITLLCFILISYRIESQINVSPVKVLEVSEIPGGRYSYETFGKSGVLNTEPLRQTAATINTIQSLIPPTVRLFIESITGCVSVVTSISQTLTG